MMLASFQHARVRRQIRRFFADDLSSYDEAQMRAHVRVCDRCRTEYDRVAELLRAAASRGPTSREEEGVWRRVEAELDAPVAAMSPASGWLAHWLPGVAVLVLVVAIGVGLLGRSRPPRVTSVQFGGGAGMVGQVRYRGEAPKPIGLEVFAVRPRPDLPAGIRGYEAPRPMADGGTLERSELIQLRYRNEDPALKYLYLFGLDRRWTPIDYLPRPAGEGRSMPIRSQAGEALALGRWISLGPRHRPGPLRVCAVFSARRLTRQAIHAAVAAARPDDRPAQLPGRLEIEPAGGGRVRIITRSFKILPGKASSRQ